MNPNTIVQKEGSSQTISVKSKPVSISLIKYISEDPRHIAVELDGVPCFLCKDCVHVVRVQLELEDMVVHRQSKKLQSPILIVRTSKSNWVISKVQHIIGAPSIDSSGWRTEVGSIQMSEKTWNATRGDPEAVVG